MIPEQSIPPTTVNRRTVAMGIAWSVPAVAAVAAAPFAAASLFKVPGINGWVSTTPNIDRSCNATLRVTSNPASPNPTSDGAPYGLYLYDVSPTGKYDAASLTYWVRGDHSSTNPITWTSGSQQSKCWSGPTAGKSATKADGFIYTPYTWKYTCTIDPSAVSRDGRLYLGTFDVSASFSQRASRTTCEPLDHWAYREIRVDADGSGPAKAQILSFERRNGASGPYPAPRGLARTSAVPSSDGPVSL